MTIGLMVKEEAPHFPWSKSHVLWQRPLGFPNSGLAVGFEEGSRTHTPLGAAFPSQLTDGQH